MIRRILVASTLVALAGCVEPTGGDDTVVALAIGGVQPALEAQNALLVAMDSCAGCDTLQELGNHIGSTLGTCASLSAVSQATKDDVDCEGEGLLIGKPLVKVALNGCDLGLGKPVSGNLFVTQAEGSVLRFFETDLIAGDHGVAACGQVSGAGGGHSLAFDSVAHGPVGGDVLFSWIGPASIDGDAHVRSGTIGVSFVGSDGIGYEVDGEASSITRAKGDSLPHAGRITFEGVQGRASIDFGDETPTTGGIKLTRSDGVQQTVILSP